MNSENNVFPKMIYTGVFYKFGICLSYGINSTKEKLIKHQMAVDDDIRTSEDAACVYPYLLNVTVCISWKICLCIVQTFPHSNDGKL